MSERRAPWFEALRAHARYIGIVLRHKWFVFVAGRRVGVPLGRLLIHDLSKFSRAEWSPYVHRFVRGRGGSMDHDADEDEWHRAWLHHWHRNPHHWEHWLRLNGDMSAHTTALVMPETYVREMVADWMGAGRAYTGRWEVGSWYEKNRDVIVLHDETRNLVEALIATRAANSQVQAV